MIQRSSITFVVGLLLTFPALYVGEGQTPLPDAIVKVNQLSDQVITVMEHYKSEDPVGVPGAAIPDPMPIAEVKTGLALGTLTLMNQQVHGLSKIRIESAYSNVADMEMSLALRIDVLQVLGNYTFRTWVSSARGASNITLHGLYAEGLARLEIAREGHLEATDIDLDIQVVDIDVKLENPGMMGSILQGAMNSIGTLVFDTMKPYIMNQLNSNILGDANKNFRDLKMTFPNSLSPLDVVFAEGRKLVRKMGYDPFKVNDFKHETGVVDLDVTHIWVTGLSSFHRVGNITVLMENNTVHIEVSAGTQQLKGVLNWEITMMGLTSTCGKLAFSIDYVEVEGKFNQSLDVRKKPNLEDLHITLGNFQLQFDGAGTLDYILEAIVNILPNLLRYQLTLAIEVPLKFKIQEIFNDIDVEKTILKQVEQISKMNSSSNNNSDRPPGVTDKPPTEEGLSVDESRLDDSIFDIV